MKQLGIKSLRNQRGSFYMTAIMLVLLGGLLTCVLKIAPLYMDNSAVRTSMEGVVARGEYKTMSIGDIRKDMLRALQVNRIEGFDADTARELQERAKEYLAQQEAELDAKRTELGVDDALKDVPGVTTKMLVALGENGVKTVEDLAGCATDDLIGWTERKDGESKHEPGFLDGFNVSREDAETMIMQARVKAGWVTEAELAPPAAEPAAEEVPQPQT